jgi:hypothetical protein
MLFNVPQFIDVEDKIAGPLTVKQVLWLIGMGAVLFIVWTFFDTPTFFRPFCSNYPHFRSLCILSTVQSVYAFLYHSRYTVFFFDPSSIRGIDRE